MMEVATEWDVLLFFPSLLKADRTHVVTHFTSVSLSHSAPAYGCSSAAGTEMDESVCHHIVLHKGKEKSVLVELLRFHHSWSEMEHLSVLQSHLMRGWKTIIDFHILIKARYQRVFCAVWKEVLLNWGSTRICWIVCTVQKKTKKQQHGVPLSTHICMNSPVLSVSNMSSCEDRISQSCWSCSEEAWRPCECSRAWTLSCLPDWPGDSSELLELTSDLEDDRTNSARIKPVCDLQWTAD